VKRVITVFTIIVLLMTVVVSSAGCEEETPTAEEIIAGIADAHASIDSYEMEMDMGVKMVTDVSLEDVTGMPSDLDVDMKLTGVSDKKNKELHMVIKMDMAAPDEDPMSIDMELYHVDGWMYIMMDMPLMSPQWMMTEMPYEEFQEGMGEIVFTSALLEMLEAAQASVTGSEEVGGVDSYVLELTPDMEQLWDIISQQVGTAGGEMPDIPAENLGDMIKDSSVKYWIAKETYYLMKSDMVINMDVLPEELGLSDEQGSLSMEINIQMLMFNYNETAPIVLPPEAENAVEKPIWP
jgi:hypothetical protein